MRLVLAHTEGNLLKRDISVLFALSSTVGTSFCILLVSLRQNQLCQQGPSITVTERFHSQWPFTVVAFETRCLSHSCSTPFKYFKWVRCGAITWLLDKHQFIHQTGDWHTAARFYFASSLQYTQVLWGYRLLTFNKTFTNQWKASNIKHYLLFLMLHKLLRN